MKKTSFLLAVIASAIIASCSEDSTPVLDESASTSEVLSEKRTFEEALQIAKSSISMIEEDEGVTRGGQGGRTIDLDRSRVVGSGATRADGTTDTLFYVFNFTDEQGFAVVSANKATEGLLAVTEKDSYDNSLNENGGFATYMEMAKGYVAAARIKPPLPFIIRDTLRQKKGPYVSVKWGQNYPEGVFFPNATAGCVNVAIAQIMSYFKYPSQISLTYPNADSVSVNLEWNSMVAHKKSFQIMVNDHCSDDYMNAHSDIAHLCRQIAYMTYSTFSPDTVNFNYNLTNYQYYPGWTGSNISSAKAAMQNLGYTTGNITSYSSLCTIVPLCNHHLIYMRGGDTSVGGHAWMVDGYMRYDIHTVSQATVPPTITDETKYYNHINWGWRGSANGYFLDNVFATNNGELYDTSDSRPNYNFNNGVQYFEVYR